MHNRNQVKKRNKWRTIKAICLLSVFACVITLNAGACELWSTGMQTFTDSDGYIYTFQSAPKCIASENADACNYYGGVWGNVTVLCEGTGPGGITSYRSFPQCMSWYFDLPCSSCYNR